MHQSPEAVHPTDHYVDLGFPLGSGRMAAEPGVMIPRWGKPGKENRYGF
jgi:hypothetical protein